MRLSKDLSEHVAIVDGKLTYTGTASQEPSIVIGPSPSKELPKDLQLHFDTNELVISKESKELTRVSYRAIETESFKSKDSLTQAISKDWYQQNRVYISSLPSSRCKLPLWFEFLYRLSRSESSPLYH